MPKPLATVMIVALLAAGMPALSAADFTPDKNFSNDAQAKDQLAEAVRQFRIGRYPDAAAALQAVLKLDPTPELLYQFYLSAGDSLLLQMEDHDELSDVMHDVLRRARIYQTSLRHTPDYIDLMISKLTSSQEERVVATLELVAIGPYAVPALMGHLNDNRQDDLRVFCRIALTRMGYRAVVPLVESLKSGDERQVESVAMILADIGDPRALPELLHLASLKDAPDTTKRVVANTIAAIVKTADLPTTPLGDAAYFTEALRYFRNDDRVHDEMVANESLMWRWDAASSKLTYQRVPRYAWSDLMAEQLLFDGLAAWPDFAAYQPLLTATLQAEITEVDQRLMLAKTATVPAADPDEELKWIQQRADALVEQNSRVAMAGPINLYRAVQQSIISGRYDVAAALMRALEDRGLAHPETCLPSAEQGLDPQIPGSVLCAALDHPDKLVRYQAAITLAHLDPATAFYNANKVVPTLAEATGEWGMRVVMVVDQDYHQRNDARERLQQKGYIVATASDGFEAMSRLEESPVKDAIIIAGDLVPTVQDEKGQLVDVPEQKAASLVAELKADWRAQNTPIFISLPEDPALSARVEHAFADKGVGFIHKPFVAEDLVGKIEESLKTAQAPNANRDIAEDISLRAALALGAPDAAKTRYDLAIAAPALAKTLDARADPIRIAACHALGVAAQSHGADAVRPLVAKLTDIYGAQEATLKPELKAAFIGAIGLLDPTTPSAQALLLKALQDPELQVRQAAAQAIGHAPSIDSQLLLKYQLQQRLDVRNQGAGPDPYANVASVNATAPADAGAAPADAPAPADK